MAYQGTVANNTSMAAGATVTAKNISNLKVAAGSTGWNLVGSYANVGSGAEAINAGNLSSSWWLISAYNSTIGDTVAGADNGSGTPTTTTAYQSSGYDYVKLFSVPGAKSSVTANSSAIPEPGSMALADMALFALFYSRRQHSL